MVENGAKSATLKSYISAIKSILTDDGYIWDNKKVMLSSLTKACRLVNDQVKTRLPIHCGLLEVLLFEIQRQYSALQPYLSLLYKTIFIIGYYGLFRIGELSEGPHVIKAKTYM